MRGKHTRFGNFLLIASIVGAILGMEIDVISGPLVSASLSLVLCNLYAPDATDSDLPPSVRLPAITLDLMSKGSTSEAPSPDNAGEVPGGYCEAEWTCPLAVPQSRQKAWARSWAKPESTYGTASVPLSPPLLRREPSRLPSDCFSTRLCRFLC